MRIRHLPLIVMVGLGLAVGGCTADSPVLPTYPPIHFTNEFPFALNVGRVEVVSDYHAPSDGTHIELEMPVSPETALRNWAKDRLHPVGATGILRVVISDAHATLTPLPVDNSLANAFTDQQSAKVDMAVTVTVQLLDDRQMVISDITGQSSRSLTLLQSTTLNERDKKLYDMVVDMMQGFDTQISPQITNNFGRWLMPG